MPCSSGAQASTTTTSASRATGFVDGFVIDHTGTAGVTFTVDVPVAGDYGLNLRYANGLGSDMTLSQVAGGEDRKITLPSAVGASWSFWFVHQEIVTLAAGEQQITYRFDADDTGNVNLDAIALTTIGDLATPGGGPTDPGSQEGAGPDTRWDDVTAVLETVKPKRGEAYEAEDAFFANGAAATIRRRRRRRRPRRRARPPRRARERRPTRARRSSRSDTPTRRAATPTSCSASTARRSVGSCCRRSTAGPRPRYASSSATASAASNCGAAARHRMPRSRSIASCSSTATAFDERGATVPYTAYEAEHGTTNARGARPESHVPRACGRGIRSAGRDARRDRRVRGVDAHRAGELARAACVDPRHRRRRGPDRVARRLRRREEGRRHPGVERVRVGLRRLPVRQRPGRRRRAAVLRRDARDVPGASRRHGAAAREGCRVRRRSRTPSTSSRPSSFPTPSRRPADSSA